MADWFARPIVKISLYVGEDFFNSKVWRPAFVVNRVNVLHNLAIVDADYFAFAGVTLSGSSTVKPQSSFSLPCAFVR